jgi:putative ABC transport system substrate-binding protein
MRVIGLVVVLAVGLCLAPLAAEAQGGKVPRIGILILPPDSGYLAALRQGLGDFGYVEGQNIALEIRSADGRPERLPGLAAELVRLKVDVIVAASNAVTATAQKTTTSIPIVMTNVSDPVAAGFVASLARPGGNITGLTIQSPDVAGKALQLLKDAVPSLSRVAVLWDPGLPGGRQNVSEVETAARALGLRLQLVEVRSPGELDGAFAAVTGERTRAALIAGSPMQMTTRAQIAELAVKRRLSTMCVLREYVQAGCLMGYGASIADQARRAAYFVDRILNGTTPTDLPVEQPTKFYFIINLKTAKALGLTIPPSVLLRADQLIQ